MDSLKYFTVSKNGKTVHAVAKEAADYFGQYWTRFENGSLEPDTFKIFDNFVGPGTTFIDIGAWIGAMSLYGAQLARVAYGFEPDPVAFDALTCNIKANSHIKNLTALRKFVAAKSGAVTLHSQYSGNNSASSAYVMNPKTSWTVEAISLTDFLHVHQINGPLFIKMDIEGAEFDVIPTPSTLVLDYSDELTIYLSLHPQILAGTIRGRSASSKLRRRFRLLRRHHRVFQTLGHLPGRYDTTGRYGCETVPIACCSVDSRAV